MKSFLTLAAFALICLPHLVHADPPVTSLFTGEDLKHWKAPQDPSCFVVKDGVLIVKNNDKQKGFVLETKEAYTNFDMSFEFLFVSGRIDSGIMLRNNKDQIQIGESGSLKRDMTGSPYIPGKGYPVEADVKDVLKKDDWNEMRIRGIGPVYTVWLNGKQVLNYTSKTAGDKGPLGIQLHGKRIMEIHYRNIEMRIPEADVKKKPL